jgi:predicted nucleic-acid-binding protein
VPVIAETAVVVRYLANSPAEQAARAAELFDGDEQVLIPGVALAEAAFALGRHYDVDREQIVDLLVDLLNRGNVETLDVASDFAIEGLLMCRPSNRVSFADALIWAAARSRPTGPLVTFDRRFPRDGLDVRVLG